MATAVGALVTTEGDTRYLRWLLLLDKGGTLVLRHVFDTQIPPPTLAAHLNSQRARLHGLKSRKVINLDQWDLLYPPSGRPPDSATFDITLLTCLLRNICSLNQASPAWAGVILPTDVSVEADICRLRNIRNEASHLAPKSLTDHEYTTKETDLEQVLLRLGAGIQDLHREINNLKTSPIDKDCERSLLETVQEWQEQGTTLIESNKEISRKVEDLTDDVSVVKEDISDIKSKVEYLPSTIKDIHMNVKTLHEEVSDLKKDIEDLPRVKDGQETVADKRMNIEGVRDKLIKMYGALEQDITIVFMGLQDKKVPVYDMYVKPRLTQKYSCKLDTSIKSLQEVFYLDNKKCQNVVISGDAGYGKTVFCKHLVYLWCSAHTKKAAQTSHVQELTDDEKVMSEFPLLFYVDLEDATFVKSNENPDEIANLIFEQLQLSDLNMTYKELKDILHDDERVLVVMDAFDECKETRLPRGGKHNTHTTLITSRPWKLELCMPNPKSKLDNEIEIFGFDEWSARELIDKLVKVSEDDTRRSEEFIDKMYEDNLRDMLCVPALLPPMFSLWFDKKPFGQSEADIYKNIIHHQIVTSINNKQLPKYTGTLESSFQFCQSTYCPCRSYRELLSKVSEFAYNTLVKSTKEENMLTSVCNEVDKNTRTTSQVVCHEQNEFPELSLKDVELCMKLGILTQYKLLGNISDRKRKRISFTHRTYIEWFAAAYISTEDNFEQKDLRNLCSGLFDNLNNVVKFGKIFQFVCGQDKSVAVKLSAHIMEIVSADKQVQGFRRSCLNFRDEMLLFMITEVQDVIVAGAVDADKNFEATTALQLNDLSLSTFYSKFSADQILACDVSHAKSVCMVDIQHQDTMPNFTLPPFACMEKVYIYNVDLTPFHSQWESLFRSNLFILHMEYVIMTHTQMDNLVCSSLPSAKNIMYLNITNPIVRTHVPTTKDVKCQLDLVNLKALSRLRLNIGDLSPIVSFVSWPSSSCIVNIDLKCVDIAPCDTFIKNLSVARLERLELQSVIITHGQVECLFENLALAENLHVFVIANLICSLHTNNKQDCLLQLDVSNHNALEVISLWDLHVSLIEVNVCQNLKRLKRLELSSMKIKHEQIERLFCSLITAENVVVLKVRELICSTHIDNRHDCNLQLDLSRHHGVEVLLLCDLPIGLREVHFCQNMFKLGRCNLGNITMKHGEVECLFGILNTLEQLTNMTIIHLVCSTHKNNKQDCNLCIDFSKHSGLETIRLWDLLVGEHLTNSNCTIPALDRRALYDGTGFCNFMDLSTLPEREELYLRDLRVGLKDIYFCQNMTKLTNVLLSNVTMKHEQIDRLFQSLDTTDQLTIVSITDLLCSTHEDNIHDCNLQLDLSKHHELETICLSHLRIGLSDIYFCQSNPKLKYVWIHNVTVKHEQLQCLFRSLDPTDQLTTMSISDLQCSTHKDNIHDCNLRLDISKHYGLETIWLWNICVGLSDVNFCQNMAKMNVLWLGNVTMKHEQIESLFRSLDSTEHLTTIRMKEFICSTHKDNKQHCNLRLDLSKHKRLYTIWLWDIKAALNKCNFSQNMTKLEHLWISNVTMPHEQIDSIIRSLDSTEHLNSLQMKELACSTHEDNRQDCDLQLNLSKHHGLGVLELMNLRVDLKDVCFCQIMTKLERLKLSNVILKHAQLEYLFRSLDSTEHLNSLQMKELVCSTHKDNRQDCDLQLNLSKHHGLEVLELMNLRVDLKDVCFCQNMTKLERLELSNVILKHAQLEYLFRSLDSTEHLTTLQMEELVCSTHKDNRQDCDLQLNLSKQYGLETIRLCDLRVSLSAVNVCQNMTKLKVFGLRNMTIKHEQLEYLFRSLDATEHLTTLQIEELACSTHKDKRQDCDLQLNLSKHHGLEVLELWDLNVDLKDVCVCQIMTKVGRLELRKVTMKHKQIQSLFRSLDSIEHLTTLQIKELACSTHQSNRQDCDLQLNLSKHHGLEVLELRDLCVDVCQNMTKLRRLNLSKVTMKHEQIERLFQSLDSTEHLTTLNMGELACSTHKDNRHDCDLQLNFSKHHQLESIWLCDLRVGLSNVNVCQNMTKLKVFGLRNITIKHEQLEYLFRSLDATEHLTTLQMGELACSTHKYNRKDCDLQLNFSKHHGLETIWLWKLRLSDVIVCQNMTKLKQVWLRNMTIKHEQLEYLFRSLNATEHLTTLQMEGLACSTHHNDNRQDCDLQLNLSKHHAMEVLELRDLCVDLKDACVCQKKTKLERLELSNLTIIIK